MSDPNKTSSSKHDTAKAAAAPSDNAGTAMVAQPAQVAANAPPAEPVAAAPQATSEPQTAAADTSSAAGRPTSAAAASASPAPLPAPAPQPTAQVIDLEDVRAEERRATLAYVTEVHELCAIAGRSDLAAGFIARAAPVAQVRKALLEPRAAEDEATAIRSQVRPATIEPPQPSIDTAAIYAARNQHAR